MLIIVDANILISAVINPESFIGLVLSSDTPQIELALPQFAIEETLKHKNKFCKKLKIPENIFDVTLARIQEISLIYSLSILSEKSTKAAFVLTSDIDPNDTVYVAFAIELNGIIWTGDLKLHHALHKKGFHNIISTSEFKRILKGLNI